MEALQDQRTFPIPFLQGKKMNYYICPECGQRYTGWANSEFCQKCGSKLRKISQEEFSLEKKGNYKGGGLK